jgi:NDP-sugar pyrophosphorylase family protein
MILAAGRGTRLGPLTQEMPKPLLPVANVPVMATGLACLRQAGITMVCANLSYRAAQIQAAFGDGAAHGVHLHWSVEEALLGTAGGMKRMEAPLAGDQVVVIAGDAMLDVDLTPLLAAHRAAGAFASLATVEVADPSHYGAVVAHPDGRIRAFQEKPAPGTEISHCVNTGIYVFEPGIFSLIPDDRPSDFARDIFPEILRRDWPFFAFPVDGYWTDIGNPGDYLQANLDYLGGRINTAADGHRVGDSLLGAGARVDGAALTRCVVGPRAVLPAGTRLTDCTVWPDTVLDAPRTLAHAILTPWGIHQVEGKSIREPARV